jgi:hypothetical protein
VGTELGEGEWNTEELQLNINQRFEAVVFPICMKVRVRGKKSKEQK